MVDVFNQMHDNRYHSGLILGFVKTFAHKNVDIPEADLQMRFSDLMTVKNQNNISSN